MTEEKICPIMTSHDWVYCQKERGMAWDEQKYLDKPGRCRLIP